MKPNDLAARSSPGLLLGLPSWLLLVAVVLPLVVGVKTLYYRDVLSTHHPLKTAQTQLDASLGAGPILDPFRGGGQPLLGNPNAVPFYPTNVLYSLADPVVAPLWALNAHFWLHWLLAPFAGYWLGRAWNLSRPGAWACGVAWATGGYVMSLLNLYNMVALAALAPATVAAYLGLARSQRPSRIAMASVCTGLTFLGGDPASAAVVYILAAAAFLAVILNRPRVPPASGVERRSVPKALLQAGVAAVIGLALAAPVLVEMLRVLPTSYRGLKGYEAASVLAQSWHPLSLVDWWIPGFFGQDLSYWGLSLYGGNPPFLSSLSPGWLVVALAAAAGFRRRARNLWAWTAVIGGVFVALGGHNPLPAWFAERVDLGLLRYPVKAWLATALGLSLLAGLGFERLWQRLGRSRTIFGSVLLALAGASVLARPLLGVGSSLAGSSLADMAREISGGRFTAASAALEAEVERWTSVWSVSLLTLAAAALIFVLSRGFSRRRPAALGLLLVLHAGSQLVLLRHLVAVDDAGPYRSESGVLTHLAQLIDGHEKAIDVVHGGFDQQFGTAYGARPLASLVALNRSLFATGSHNAGIARGLRYPFVRSPEGLDSFYAVVFAKALPGLNDAGRLRLLEAAGVEVLLLERPLSPAASARVEQIAVIPEGNTGRATWVYRLLHGAPEASLVAGVRRADTLTAARNALLDPSFDPRREVVLAGDGPGVPSSRVEPQIEVEACGPECLSARADSEVDSYLVLQRAWLPIWKAEVDGEPVEIEIANGWQMAVAVPAGHHDVSFCVDEGPRRTARFVLFGALLLLGLMFFSKPRAAQAESDPSSGV